MKDLTANHPAKYPFSTEKTSRSNPAKSRTNNYSKSNTIEIDRICGNRVFSLGKITMNTEQPKQMTILSFMDRIEKELNEKFLQKISKSDRLQNMAQIKKIKKPDKSSKWGYGTYHVCCFFFGCNVPLSLWKELRLFISFQR